MTVSVGDRVSFIVSAYSGHFYVGAMAVGTVVHVSDGAPFAGSIAIEDVYGDHHNVDARHVTDGGDLLQVIHKGDL